MATMVGDRVEQGPWASFDAYVDARGAALWRSAWLLTGDRHRAEDLVQDALSRCWSRFDGLNRDGHSFDGYVRTALFRAHLSWWRRGQWRERPYETLPDSPSAQAAGRTQPIDLVRALLDLPPRQRAVVVLRYLDDLSEAATASTLGISAGSVKQHAHRGLAALRRSPHLSEAERAIVPDTQGASDE